MGLAMAEQKSEEVELLFESFEAEPGSLEPEESGKATVSNAYLAQARCWCLIPISSYVDKVVES